MKQIEDFTNKIICGDCLEVMKEMPDNSIDMVLTDVPYGELNDLRRGGIREFHKTDADIVNFDMGLMLNELCRITKGSIYIFCSSRQVSGIRGYFKDKNLPTRHCIWEKKNPAPTNGQFMWLSSMENCIYAKKPKAVFNEFCKSCVWHYNSDISKYHPTQKPIKLFRRLIQASSKMGDIVLDGFMGSGTTCVASKELGRKFIGIDISEKYCEIARKRLDQEVLIY